MLVVATEIQNTVLCCIVSVLCCLSYMFKGLPASIPPDAVPPIHAESYHVATDKGPSIDGGKFRSILATIYNQSQLAERKHVARYWSINTAARAVPLSAHPSPLVITAKLAVAIFGGALYGGGALPAQYYPCGRY